MVRRLIAAAAASLLSAAGSLAQQPAPPLPLFPPPPPGSFQSEPPPSSFQAEPLPPPASAPDMPRPPDQRPPGPGMLEAGPRPGITPPAGPPGVGPPPAGPPPASSPATPAAARVFCDQPVTIRIADRDRVPERYRAFVGMWSDAAWTPQLCAALVVEDVVPDGTARIVYAFGPIGSPRGAGVRPSGGVLHGTGVIRDGELRFQNSDGSQFTFRAIYSDLDGRLTTPQGQSHQAIFKKTL